MARHYDQQARFSTETQGPITRLTRVGFGGGCHWCTEAVFQALHGVERVEQGYIASTEPFDRFSEAVIVHYTADAPKLRMLIEAHLHTHASTSTHSMRSKYRSAVYCFDESQENEASNALAELQATFDAPLITQVLPFVSFKPSETRFRNYYANHPDRPFCRTYIEPKLKNLARQMQHQID